MKCFKKVAVLDTCEEDVREKCNRCSCEKLSGFGVKKLLETKDPKIHALFCLKGNTK